MQKVTNGCPFRAVRAGSAFAFQARLWALSLMLIVGGCAGSMGTMRENPPAPPPITAFDGAYRTTLRLTSAFGSSQVTTWCQSPGQSTITVANGQFTYALPHPNVPGNATPTYTATMAEDGSFSGEIVAGTISGRVQGRHIEGRIDGSACVYAFSGERL